MRSDRLIHALVGGALALSGLRARGLLRFALGGALLYQAYTGRSPLMRRLGIRVNSHAPGGGAETIVAAERVTIAAPRAALYRHWRNFANLPRFMRHLAAVRVVNERRSHWMAQAPAGRIVEWDAEVVEDRPDELLRWRSLPGAQIINFGLVRFADAPAGQGTEVYAELQYVPAGGVIGAALARLTGEEPQLQLAEDLQRLKQLAESGELSPATAAATSPQPSL